MVMNLVPKRFMVGLSTGLTREDMIALGQAARHQGVDPRELAARLIADGLRQMRIAPVPDGNVSEGAGWGYPQSEEG